VLPAEGPLLRGAEADFVAAARVSHLATTDPTGEPHVVPICHVLDLDHVVFASETDTRKVRNLIADGRAAICVDEYSEDWTALRQVIVRGEALIVDPGYEWERGRQLLYDKYPQYEDESPIDDGSTIVAVRIDQVVSWGF
jgi:PPOX class probable F420-dependent enzyme